MGRHIKDLLTLEIPGVELLDREIGLYPLQFRLNVRVQGGLRSMKVARTCTSPREPPFSPLPLSAPTFVCSYQACSTTILQPKPSTQTSQSTRCFPNPLSPASGRAVVAFLRTTNRWARCNGVRRVMHSGDQERVWVLT
jgi:hypothetical protein